MPKPAFYQLGLDPSAEASRIYNLYADKGVDSAVINEFESTVKAYQSLSLSEISARLIARYGGEDPMAVGTILEIDGVDVGMAIWGDKDYPGNAGSDLNIRSERGINISAWILSQYRNLGLGKSLLSHAVDDAKERASQPTSTWYDRKVWTSIRPANIASRLACEHAGFVEVGIQADQPSRLLYQLVS